MSFSRAKASALLALLSLVLYAPSIGYGFVEYDDQTILLGQPHLFAVSFWDGVRAIFTHLPREEPLIVRDLTWLVDSHLFGFENPLGYHLGNVLLNALDTVLVFLFLARATRRQELAVIAALFFAILPTHVETVCWVMGRKDLLSTCFMLLALIAESRLLDGGPRWLWALGFLFTCSAVLAKIGAAPFFLVLLLHRLLLPYLRGEPAAPALRPILCHALALAPHAIASLALMVWYQGVLHDYGMFGRGPPPLSAEHLGTLARFVPVVLLENARLLFLPDDLQLFYDFPAVGRSIGSLHLFAAYLFTAGFALALLYTARFRRDLFFHQASIAILIAPYLNLVYIGIWLANRYLYFISLFAIAIPVTIFLERVRRPVALAVGASWALFCIVQSVLLLPAWRDNASLWEHELALSQPSMLAFSAAARIAVQRAESTHDPQAIAEAKRLIDRGMEHYRSLGDEPVPGYVDYQRQYFGKLHHFRARIRALEGEPLAAQLDDYRIAYDTEPTSQLNNMSLAEVYFKLAFSSEASEQRSDFAHRSLSHFERYAAGALHDPSERQNVAQMLERNYASRFPELLEEIAEVRRRLGL